MDFLLVLPSGAIFLVEVRGAWSIPTANGRAGERVVKLPKRGVFRRWAETVGIPVEPRRRGWAIYEVAPRSDADLVLLGLTWM